MNTEEIAKGVARSARTILETSMWDDMKVIAILALVGGWNQTELDDAIKQLVYGTGWSRMTSIGDQINEPLERFIEEVGRINAENDRQKAEVAAMG